MHVSLDKIDRDLTHEHAHDYETFYASILFGFVEQVQRSDGHNKRHWFAFSLNCESYRRITHYNRDKGAVGEVPNGHFR